MPREVRVELTGAPSKTSIVSKTPAAGSGERPIGHEAIVAFCGGVIGLRRIWRHLRAHGPRRTSAESHADSAAPLRARAPDRATKELDSIVARRAPSYAWRTSAPGSLEDLSALNSRRGQQGADRRFARYVEEGFPGFVGYRDGAEPWATTGGWTRAPARASRTSATRGSGIELAQKDVYGSDFYLLEEHRGGGIAAGFLGTSRPRCTIAATDGSGATWSARTGPPVGSTVRGDTSRCGRYTAASRAPSANDSRVPLTMERSE